MDRLHRIGAYAAFALTIQFLATLVWVAAAWPPEGLAGLTEAMADSFLIHSQAPFPFALVNLYNASFAASAVVLVTVIREYLTEAPRLMRLAVIAITVAASLFLASGIIPVVSIPHLVRANDSSAVNAIVGVVTGLVLGATSAAGTGVVLSGAALLRAGRLPRLLCYLIILDGAMQIAEFAVSPFLVLDPLAGAIWSLWLGIVLWRDGLVVRAPKPQSRNLAKDQRTS
jgi:hypothetical protein